MWPNSFSGSKPALSVLSVACALALLSWREASAQQLQSPWAGFGKTMAAQGYTGLMNIPTADITPAGTLEMGLNNHVDPRLSATNPKANNYLLSFGVLPYLEIGGRLAEMPSPNINPVFGTHLGVRDLSGNIKFQLPHLFQPDTQIALGMEDLGGGAPFFRSTYGVVTQTVGPFKLTGGYGRGPDRLKGVFAGADVHLRDGFYLMAEKEPVGYTVGARWFSPNISAINDGRVVFSVHAPVTTVSYLPKRALEASIALQIPLSGQYTAKAPESAAPPAAWQTGRSALDGPRSMPVVAVAAVPTTPTTPAAAVPSTGEVNLNAALATTTSASAAAPPPVPTVGDGRSVAAVRAALLAQGFAGVRLGRSGTTLVITYQNYRYNVNETDALGLVLGHAAMLAPDAFERVAVYTYREGLPVAVTNASIAKYRDYLQGGNKQVAMTDLTSRPAGKGVAENVEWDGDTERDAPRLRVRLTPKLVQFVGTEVGLFNYSIGLGIQGNAPVWKGGTLSVESVLSLADSEQVQPGKPFYRFRVRDGVQNMAFNQTFWLTNDIISLTSAGRFQYDYNGITNDSTWMSANGMHGLETRVGLYKAIAGSGQLDRSFGVGTYQYYYWPYDTVLRATYGRYLVGDHGVTLEARHRFGDVDVSLFYKQTSVKLAGLQISIPLTPRQEMKAASIIFQGPERWSTGLQTSLAAAGQGNPLYPDAASFPGTDYNLNRVFLNYGRLNQTYLLKNFERLKDAYWRYRGQ